MKIKKTIIAGLMAIFAITSCTAKGSNTSSSKETNLEALKGKEGVFAVLETEKGTIVLNLFYKETPMTVSNFVGLAEGTLDAAKGKPFYDGLKFHRVISDFMIQGGDPQGNGTGGPGYKFADEFVEGYIFDKPGKLAMANSGANTNGSQFFITHVPTDWLNYKHTIFGEVLEGQNVVDSVAQGDTIKSLKIIRQGKDAEAFKVTQKSFDELKAAGAKKAAKFKEELSAKKIAEITKDCEKDEDGIFYKITKKGSGPVCGKGKTVTVEYKLYMPDTKQILDASSAFHPQGHEAIEFKTGSGQMIPGFDKMVSQMKYGETRTMVLPPAQAYGPMGGIPQLGVSADDYICFDVTLVK